MPGMQSPFSLMLQLSREMDRLMDSFFSRSFGLSAGFPRLGELTESAVPTMWVPRVDVREQADSIVVRADVPGVKKEDIRVEASDDALVISGERREEREEGDEGYRFSERTYGSFYRQIPMPEGAQLDQAKATCRDGVLEVTVPYQSTQKRRQIQIES